MTARALLFGASALVVAFASMAYELTLAQSMAVLYGDTITSYSLVIGFFVLSLGLGSAYWAKASRRPTAFTFWTIEMILAGLGALAPWLIFASEFKAGSGVPWGMVTALAMAFAIGLFSGMEIPLLIALSKSDAVAESRTTGFVIGLDFLGTFFASVLVPLWLFVALGLVGVPLLGGLLNVGLGVAVLTWGGERLSLPRLGFTLAMAGALMFAMTRVESIEAFLAAGVF